MKHIFTITCFCFLIVSSLFAMDQVEIKWDVGPNVPDNILEEIKADLAAGLTPDGLKYHI